MEWQEGIYGSGNKGKQLFRSRDGLLMGVCRGFSDYFGFSVTKVRTGAAIVLLVTGIWPMVGLYLLAALLMKPEPVIPIASAGEEAFYDGYVHCRRDAIFRLKRRFDRLDRRIRRMEDIVTQKEFSWRHRTGL